MKSIDIKKATLLAIIGLIIVFCLDIFSVIFNYITIFKDLDGISLKYYFIDLLGPLAKLLIIIFFVQLYKNQNKSK